MRMLSWIGRFIRRLLQPKQLVHAARVYPPGTAEVAWVASISDKDAPTAAELNAGVDLTGFVRGLPNIPETGNTADISDLSSGFNKRAAASYGGDTLTLEAYMDDGTDTAYDTLIRGTAGHVVVADYGLATTGTFAVADEVWVYPVTIISRGKGVPGRDEDEFFISECAITDVPNEKYAVAS